MPRSRARPSCFSFSRDRHSEQANRQAPSYASGSFSGDGGGPRLVLAPNLCHCALRPVRVQGGPFHPAYFAPSSLTLPACLPVRRLPQDCLAAPFSAVLTQYEARGDNGAPPNRCVLCPDDSPLVLWQWPLTFRQLANPPGFSGRVLRALATGLPRSL